MGVTPQFDREMGARAAICYMALILHRIMRMRLAAASAETSPERALACLRRYPVPAHSTDLNPVSDVSTIQD